MKYFDNSDNIQKWLHLWKEICKVPIFEAYQQAQIEFHIQNSLSISTYQDYCFNILIKNI